MNKEEEYAAEYLESSVRSVVSSLRALADRIERDVRLPSSPDQMYGQAAEDVVHEINWGVANLNLERVVRAAVRADIARFSVGKDKA